MPACCWTMHGGGERAHASGRARAVGDVHEIDAVDAQLARLLDQRFGAVAARRHQLDADHEVAARERVRHARLLGARDGHGRRRGPAAGAAARAAAGARRRRTSSAPCARTACLICRMCSGVVPQQPPTRRTPVLMKRRAYDAMYSGEQR